MDEHPIYDSLSAIYRYQGGWAFEDYGDAWRPWSTAWDDLCHAPYLVGYRDMSGEFEKLRMRLIMHALFSSVTQDT